MRVAARAWSAESDAPRCALCDEARATSTIVPPFHTIQQPGTQRPVHVYTMKLCEECRVEFTAGRAKLGWSWLAGRWGRMGAKSPDGDRYVRVGPRR